MVLMYIRLRMEGRRIFWIFSTVQMKVNKIFPLVQCHAHLGDPSTGAGLEGPVESEQHAYSSRFPAQIHQV